MSSLNDAIGGYFSLELPVKSFDKYADSIKFQSARAAFYALLQQCPHINHIYVPFYICNSMLAPIFALGKTVSYYKINKKLQIEGDILLGECDLLLYVNYFGVCDDNVRYILMNHNPNQIVIDCSQAFYSGPYDCLATIYSPRKFFGIPDGGLLITKKNLINPDEQDQDSYSRMTHLIKRLALSAEEGYSNYQIAEDTLADLKPKKMSNLTIRLLNSIDYSAVERRRNDNFSILNEILKGGNLLNFEGTKDAPMCYPYLHTRKVDKISFGKKRIFIPTYWPEVANKVQKNAFEAELLNNLIAIPCDQRYDENDMKKMCMEIKNELLS